MLPLLNLDDRQFEQWIAEARKAIQKRYPEWTDENAHDPGITLLELFSWFGEMQQFYLSRIQASSEKKFLKLLGTKIEEAKCSSSYIVIDNVTIDGFLPQGVKVYADEVPFETQRPVHLLRASIDKVIVRSETEANDFTSSNRNDGVSYYAFGASSRKGNRFYIGFDEPLPVGMATDLFVKLSDHYPIQAGEYDPRLHSFVPSAQVSWLYYGEDEESADGWRKVDLIADRTQHLSFSGWLTFRAESRMKPLTLHPANDRPRYWLSCVLEEEGYELPPKIDCVSLNTVQVAQQDTLSFYRTFQSDGTGGQQVIVGDRLAYEGEIGVQIQNQDGSWSDWEETEVFTGHGSDSEVYRVERDIQTYRSIVSFGGGENGKAPEKGSLIRILFYEPGLQADRWLGSGSGLPMQSRMLPWKPIIGETFGLQIAETDQSSGKLRWFDWQRVDDFDRSGSASRHYTLDPLAGTIRFGDNEHGLAPEQADIPTIRILALQVGGGALGNVKRHKIERFSDTANWWGQLSATNPDDAHGGADAETLAEAKRRAMLAIRSPDRAVTDEDYERLAKKTPGLRVARVKALPLYKPELADYPRETAPAQITIVVVPYSENRIPIPGKSFLHNVYQHLEPYRLITTELHVIPPEYVKVTVHAVVIVEPSFKKDSPKIRNALNRLLQPLDHGKEGKGWEFGRSVYRGDIYGTINQIGGVAYIQDLWLEAEGIGVVKDRSGDILLPPHGLVYSGEHQIECISRTEI